MQQLTKPVGWLPFAGHQNVQRTRWKTANNPWWLFVSILGISRWTEIAYDLVGKRAFSKITESSWALCGAALVTIYELLKTICISLYMLLVSHRFCPVFTEMAKLHWKFSGMPTAHVTCFFVTAKTLYVAIAYGLYLFSWINPWLEFEIASCSHEVQHDFLPH